MPWIISNGKSYVEIIGNNQMITTAYIDRAHTFNNKKTAEKYCSLLPKAMKNLKYKVIFISNPNPENPDLQPELLAPELFQRFHSYHPKPEGNTGGRPAEGGAGD